MPTGPYLVSSIAPITGADAGFRVRGTPVAYPGFQRGGCLRSGPIRKVEGGGGGQSTSGPIYEKWGEGGAVHFRSDIRKVGQFASGPIRKVGGQSDIRKVGGGGGGRAIRFGSDTKSVWGGGGGAIPLQVRYLCLAQDNIYMYLHTCYLGILHTRARMNLKNTCRQRLTYYKFFVIALHAPPPPPPPKSATASAFINPPNRHYSFKCD